jgi:RNA polymerase-binding transcription factor DksA
VRKEGATGRVDGDEGTLSRTVTMAEKKVGTAKVVAPDTQAAAAQGAAPATAGSAAKSTAGKKKRAADIGFSPEEALRRRAEEAHSIVDFVDHTTLGGSEEDVTGELSTADQHPADTSDMTFQRELDLTVRNIAEQRVAEVEEALARQRAGTYGICAECGQPIDPERLRARPESTTCIECARQKEQAAHLA